MIYRSIYIEFYCPVNKFPLRGWITIYLGLSFIVVRMVLVGVVFLLGVVFSKKINFYEEKISPFECGFSPIFNARLPFSMRFFLISLVFLVFDVELVILFPFVINITGRAIFTIDLIVGFFIFILILGLYHEWNQGRLDWVN